MSSEPASILTKNFPAGESIPNNPHLPTLIYQGAKSPSETDLASWWNQTFSQQGWTGLWRWSIFEYHHFHPDAHEVLGVARGQAVLQLGGPEGQSLEVSAGDVIIIPAGVGHKKIESSRGFQVIGGYPPGQSNPEILREMSMVPDSLKSQIEGVPLPETDPVYGESGPLMDHWKG